MSNQRAAEILRSDSATNIARDYEALKKLLLRYKKILDMRNPGLNDKSLSFRITKDIENNKDEISLLPNSSYGDYLKKAFDENTRYRSDFLILGIYKMLYSAYHVKDGTHLTALGYSAESFKKAYYTLKVLRWKIRNAKDKEGRYIFATWQLNWQLEYNKRYKNVDIDTIKYLPSLKSGKETLLSHSNFNFEVTLSLMISRLENSLRSIGEEPLNLSISAMKAIILI